MSGSANASRQSSSSTTTQTVPKWQRKYLEDLYGRAQSEIANNPGEFYPGATVAAQDPATVAANQLLVQRGMGGSPLVDAAQGQTQDVISGRYLSPESNPYLRATYDQASRAVTDNYRDAVLPALQSRFAQAGQGMSGNFEGAYGRANAALGTSLADLGTQIYGGAYGDERARQEAASRAAPALAEQDFRNIEAVGSAGLNREQYAQSVLDDLIARFDYAQNEPAQRLSRYASLLGNPITLSQSNSRSSGWGGGFSFSLPGA